MWWHYNHSYFGFGVVQRLNGRKTRSTKIRLSAKCTKSASGDVGVSAAAGLMFVYDRQTSMTAVSTAEHRIQDTTLCVCVRVDVCKGGWELGTYWVKRSLPNRTCIVWRSYKLKLHFKSITDFTDEIILLVGLLTHIRAQTAACIAIASTIVFNLRMPECMPCP